MSSLWQIYLQSVRSLFVDGRIRSITTPQLGRIVRLLRLLAGEKVGKHKSFSMSCRALARKIAAQLSREGLTKSGCVHGCPPTKKSGALYSWRVGDEPLTFSELRQSVAARREQTKASYCHRGLYYLRSIEVHSLNGHHGGLAVIESGPITLVSQANENDSLVAASIFTALLEKRLADAQCFITNFDANEGRYPANSCSMCPGYGSGRRDVFGCHYVYWPPAAAIYRPGISTVLIHDAEFLSRGCGNSMDDPEFQKFPQDLVAEYYERGQAFELW